MKPIRSRDKLPPLLLLLGFGGYFAFAALRPVDDLPRLERESVSGARFAAEADARILREWMELKDPAAVFLPQAYSAGVAATSASLAPGNLPQCGDS